ncbi:DUF6520 family protein [Sphingobacterium siyangense]|uniref:DUF6520 family protein n=1 Tax=Sphingobacterium siyangense TaxID=459529 RepID=UPI002FDA6A37
MKKVLLSASALILATAFSFAGTPETKTNTKPEVKSETVLKTYHYQSQNPDGTINFVEGTGSCPTPGNNICEWTSSEELESPMLPSDISSNPNVSVTKTRN